MQANITKLKCVCISEEEGRAWNDLTLTRYK